MLLSPGFCRQTLENCLKVSSALLSTFLLFLPHFAGSFRVLNIPPSFVSHVCLFHLLRRALSNFFSFSSFYVLYLKPVSSLQLFFILAPSTLAHARRTSSLSSGFFFLRFPAFFSLSSFIFCVAQQSGETSLYSGGGNGSLYWQIILTMLNGKWNWVYKMIVCASRLRTAEWLWRDDDEEIDERRRAAPGVRWCVTWWRIMSTVEWKSPKRTKRIFSALIRSIC